jgi:transposase-like protein
MTTIHLKQLIDDRKCYEMIRQLRWSEGTKCPACNSSDIKKRGFHSRQTQRQRYVCGACHQQFDDLTDTIFEGHHQPLKTWILCLYLMGLNLSNEQIAQELDLSSGDVQAMTSQLRAGIVSKKSQSC